MTPDEAVKLQEKTESLFTEALKEFEKVLAHGSEEEKADVGYFLQNKEMMALFGELTEAAATSVVD